MVGAFSSNARRPSTGSWIDNWLKRQKPHADSFDCGVRVLTGDVAGERSRWRFTVSAVDRHAPAGIVVLRRSATSALHLRVADDVSVSVGARPHHVVFAATEADTRAEVEISVPLAELVRFGIDV